MEIKRLNSSISVCIAISLFTSFSLESADFLFCSLWNTDEFNSISLIEFDIKFISELVSDNSTEKLHNFDSKKLIIHAVSDNNKLAEDSVLMVPNCSLAIKDKKS